MLRRRGDQLAADRVLRKAAENVRGRLVTAWIKLSLERGRTLRKRNGAEAMAIFQEALRTVDRLGLEKRSTELRQLLNS
jgi:hypothetical protein